MAIRTATSQDIVRRIRNHAQDAGRPTPMFTLLVGAGVSLGAGMPSTSMLVAAMKARKAAIDEQRPPLSWAELLESAASTPTDGKTSVAITGEYQQLFNDDELFATPPKRQRFISESILWAASKRPPLSPESLFLATILLAGSGPHGHHPKLEKDVSLGGWLAHTAYTTNFDEVLPHTLRYCAEPVITVDHPDAHGRLHGQPRCPRVAYLHGCHLHYALRNTAAELERPDADRTNGVDLTGLFQRFREELRGTGLIILGYSGWNDLAVRAIRHALADAESLPYGLYWGAKFGQESLSETAQQLLRDHWDRAHLLDPGKDAATTLRSLCEGLQLPHSENMARWASHLSVVASKLASYAGESTSPGLSPANKVTPQLPVTANELTATSSQDLQREFLEAKLVGEAEALREPINEDAAAAWIAKAQTAIDSTRTQQGSPSPHLLFHLGRLLAATGESDRALEFLEGARRDFQTQGAEQMSETALLHQLALMTTELQRIPEAEKLAVQAAVRLKRRDPQMYMAMVARAVLAALELGEVSRAEKYLDEARASADVTDDTGAAVLLQRTSAQTSLRRCDYEGATSQIRAALHASKDSVVKRSQISAMVTLGAIERARREFSAARLVLNQAYKLASGTNDAQALAAIQVELGGLELKAGNLEQAAEHYRRASQCRTRRALWTTKARAEVGMAETAALQSDRADRAAHADTIARIAAEAAARSQIRLSRDLKLSEARVRTHAGQLDEAQQIATTLRTDGENSGDVLLVEAANEILSQLDIARKSQVRAVS